MASNWIPSHYCWKCDRWWKVTEIEQGVFHTYRFGDDNDSEEEENFPQPTCLNCRVPLKELMFALDDD